MKKTNKIIKALSMTLFALGVLSGCKVTSNTTTKANVTTTSKTQTSTTVNTTTTKIEKSVVVDNVRYELDSTKSFYTAVSLNKDEFILKIKDYINGIPVTKIDSYFGARNTLSITIPSTIEEIGERAFYDCDKLYEIYNYSNLELEVNTDSYGYIAQDALVINKEDTDSIIIVDNDYAYIEKDNRYYLIDVLLDNTTYNLILPEKFNNESYDIYYNCFYNDDYIRYVKIPNGVEKIMDGAFRSTDRLVSIELPETLKSIGEYAFSYSSLTSITLPNSLEEVGDMAFGGCYYLVEVLNTNDSIKYEDNTIFSYALYRSNEKEESKVHHTDDGYYYFDYNDCNYILKYLGNEVDLVLPNNLNSNSKYEIHEEAFSAFLYLKSVVIPDKYVKIGTYAFSQCINLESVSIASSVTYIGRYAFYNNSSLEFIDLPKAELGSSILYGSSVSKIVLQEEQELDENTLDESMVEKIYYNGSEGTSLILSDESILENITVYYFTSNGASETKTGNYFYYDNDGNIVEIVNK